MSVDSACRCDPVRKEGWPWYAHQPGCPQRIVAEHEKRDVPVDSIPDVMVGVSLRDLASIVHVGPFPVKDNWCRICEMRTGPAHYCEPHEAARWRIERLVLGRLR